MPDYPSPADRDPASLRMSVARFAKLLVRARWKADPGFLPPDDLERWGLGNIAADPYPAWRLLARAADDLVALDDEYLGRCPSGGVPITDRDTPESRLVASAAFLADPFNSGPCDDRGLREAASELRGGGTVDWRRLVDWDLLGPIRDDLDRLPLSPRSADGSARPTPHATGDGSDSYLFRFAAGHWNVRYAGGALFALPDAPGLVYLRELLRRPGAAWAVPATELAGALHRHRAVRRCRPGVEPGAEGIGRGGGSDAGPVLDQAALDACRREYERIDRELDRAGRDNDPARVERLRAERRELADFVDRARRPGGRAVGLGDERRKAADRVTKAIRRAVDKIRGHDPRFAAHLDAAVATGAECAYAPEAPPAWCT